MMIYCIKFFMLNQVFHFRVEDIHLYKTGFRVNLIFVARGKIIQGNHFMPQFDIGIYNMGTNEPCSVRSLTEGPFTSD